MFEPWPTGHDGSRSALTKPMIDFVNELRLMKVTPHVTQNTNGRHSAIDGPMTRHGGYVVSQRIEEAFGWIKTVAWHDKTTFCGRDRVGWAFTFARPSTISCGCRSC